MACANRQAVKVVLIDTRYVETDPMSFKSVVQSLTGKDSCVAWIEQSSFGGAKRKRPVGVNGSSFELRPGLEDNGESGGNGGKASILAKGLSFKDLDTMILEAPPMEELRFLWAE